MIVLLNGPPGVGKGVIAHELTQQVVGLKEFSFANRLHEIAIVTTGLHRNVYFAMYNNREMKDVPQKEFLGFSPRRLIQVLAEDMYKPVFGDDYFAKQMAEECAPHGLVVFDDLGFQIELSTMVEKFGAEEITVLRIYRDGCDFAKDTRNYLYPPNVRSFRIDNNGTIPGVVDRIIRFT